MLTTFSSRRSGTTHSRIPHTPLPYGQLVVPTRLSISAFHSSRGMPAQRIHVVGYFQQAAAVGAGIDDIVEGILAGAAPEAAKMRPEIAGILCDFRVHFLLQR